MIKTMVISGGFKWWFCLQGAVLNITGVKRTDSGSYTVQAKNDEGKSNFTMVLNVQCE